MNELEKWISLPESERERFLIEGPHPFADVDEWEVLEASADLLRAASAGKLRSAEVIKKTLIAVRRDWENSISTAAFLGRAVGSSVLEDAAERLGIDLDETPENADVEK